MWLWFYGLAGAFVFGTARLNAVYWTEKSTEVRRKIVADYITALLTGAIFGQLAAEPTREFVLKWFKITIEINTAAGLIGLVCQYWPDLASYLRNKYSAVTKALATKDGEI